MNMPARLSRSFRVSSWVNDISPTNWKTVVTGYMQIIGVSIFWLGWLVDVIVAVWRKQPVDFHETSLGLMLGFLAGLSGFTLYGRITDRKTDYGYVERVGANKAMTPAPQQVNMGDNAQLNVSGPTTEMAIPEPSKSPIPPIPPIPPNAPNAPNAPNGATAKVNKVDTVADEDDQGLG